MSFDFITLCDGYKLDHRRQYPKGTEYVYSNWTPRSSRVLGVDKVVFFGLQYFLAAYLQELAHETFFGKQRGAVLRKYQRTLDSYLGPNNIGVQHISDLHDLGYIPLRFKALPEGTKVPLRVPALTVENTRPEFFWVTNYIETLLSNVLWKACTSATTALRFRRALEQAAAATGGDPAFIDWQGHDFSFRGMSGPEDAALSGAGHLLSFAGTDTIPAIQLLDRYYGPNTELVGGSVAATEHSVMCAGGQDGEIQTFERLLDVYPSGILSVVSDTWDLWFVLGTILPTLKERIMGREGKLVIRPDSGDPADILCGKGCCDGCKTGTADCDVNPFVAQKYHEAERKGVIETLWDIFGGTINASGYKVLDPHIGAIYGDSINTERAADILSRLAAKGFASTNVVFGCGSYNYQYVTRDTYGFAMKATWAQVNGKGYALFKDPVTDDGGKRSAKGRLAVVDYGRGPELADGYTVTNPIAGDILETVWQNGRFTKTHTLAEIRARLK
jgi:nicotinamide phosphoribosyltransferase